MSVDVATHATARLLTLPEDVDSVAWLPDGTVVAGSRTRILRASPASPAWREVVDLAGKIGGTITRLVISGDHRRIAIVLHLDA